MVKAINGAGLVSDSIVSDGVLYLEFVGINEYNILLNELIVSPNPVTHNASLSLISSVSSKATYYLLDAVGKLIEQKELTITAGINTLTINAEQLNLAKGIYYIQVQLSNEKITKN